MERWVGEPIQRIDGVDKVTGRARYVDDIHVEGALHGATVRSLLPWVERAIYLAKLPNQWLTPPKRQLPAAAKKEELVQISVAESGESARPE